jgi:hypothetical protein
LPGYWECNISLLIILSLNSDQLFSILRIVHIAAGTVAFIVAPIALIVKKGGAAHRLWGKVFFWSMVVIGLTAAIMAPMHNNIFLTLLAVFSFYLAFIGYRAVFRKKGQVNSIDWIATTINTLFSLTLFVYGIYRLPNAFGIISIVFGSIGTLLGIRHYAAYIKPRKKNQWFFDHMTGMITAYIATLSAFSAVNLNYPWLPVWLQWLWPTIIGAPLLARTAKKYRKKFNKGRRIEEEVIVRTD